MTANDAAAAAVAARRDRLLRYTSLEKLLEAGRNEEIKFLDGRYLIELYAAGDKVLRRQAMEPRAFLPAEVLTQVQANAGKLELFALSYCWSTPGHPDPDSFHLERVVKVLQAFLAGRKPTNNLSPEISSLTNYGLEQAGYQFGPANQDTAVGVFWDFVSLPQEPFYDNAEKELFKLGFGSINAIYGNQHVTKLIFPELPEASRTLRPGYDASGWTSFELQVANLASPPHRLIRLDGPFMKEHLLQCTREIPSDAWIKLTLEGGMQIERKGPRLPDDFAKDLQSLRFTIGTDQQLVIDKYREAFENIITNAEDFNANSFGLSTEAARQLLQVLQQKCQQLRSLNLFANDEVQLPLDEIAMHLRGFKLEELKLAVCKRVHGHLAAMEVLPHLRVLNLDSCEHVRGDLEHLAPLTKLEILDLQECSWVRGNLRSLSRLTRLQGLNLKNCTEVQGDFSSLSPLKNLRKLWLCNCRQITGELSELAANQFPLQKLGLRGCRLVRGSLSALAGLTKLQELVLGKCPEVEGDLIALSQLTEMQVLSLQGCSQVVGTLSCLAALTKLEFLSLSNCREVEGDLEALSQVASLQKLCLDGCSNVHGKLPQEGVKIIGYDNEMPRPAPHNPPPAATSAWSCCCCM